MILDLLAAEQRGAIERWVKAQAHGVPMPNGDTLCRVLGEWPFVVTLDDLSIAPHLVLDGYWEMWVTMCLARRIKKGWRCIDVGANFGYYTVLLSKLVGETGAVEAWEPQYALVDRLRQTLAMNGLSTERIVEHGADSVRRTVSVLRKPHDYGGVELWDVDRLPLADMKAMVVPLTDTRLERVDFVKIDTEGMEPGVWEGGVAALRPQAVLLEWSPAKYGGDAAAFLARIKSDGYTIGRVNQHGDVALVPEGELVTLTGIAGWEALWCERSQ